MNICGIDLSMRSTGICVFDGDKDHFFMVKSKKNDEELLIENADIICKIIASHNIKKIHLEGLSFNSVSSSKDLIAGNFWYVRTILKQRFPEIEICVIPVQKWRSKILTKEDNKARKIAKDVLKEFSKGKSKEEIKQFKLLSSIKNQTYLKLPETIKNQIDEMTNKDEKYDLTDSYFICHFKG